MQSSQLPKINSDSLATWAETFAARVASYVDALKRGEQVVINEGGNKNPFLGQVYDSYGFYCDSYIGDLPWRHEQSEEVIRQCMAIPGYKEASEYLFAQVFKNQEGKVKCSTERS